MPLIVFNGKTYNSIDEMPANERQAYEHLSNVFVDKNGNGIPDFMEGDMVHNLMTAFSGSSVINLNGQTYNGMDQLPPEVQEKIKNAFGKLSQFGIAPANSPMLTSAPMAQFTQSPAPSSVPLQFDQNSSAIQDGTSSNLLLGIGLGVSAMLCLVLVAAGIFLYLR